MVAFSPQLGAERPATCVDVVDALKCRMMHQPYGTATQTGTDNAARLNEYFRGEGSHGWRRLGGPLYIPRGSLGISATVDTMGYHAGTTTETQNFAHAIWGAGGNTIQLSQLQRETTLGGGGSNIVCLDKTGLTDGVMLDVNTYGLELHGVGIMGWWNATDYNAMVAATSSFAPIGIRIRGNDGTVGMGKLWAPYLTVGMCTTGIVCGEASGDLNADQIWIGDYRSPFCTTGIKLKNVTSVGHYVGQYEGYETAVMLEIENGGKFDGGQWTMEKSGGTLLKVSANTGGEASLTLRKVIVDIAADGSKIVDHAVAGALGVQIGFLDIDYNLALGVVEPPAVALANAFVLRGKAGIDVLGGQFIPEELVKIVDGADSAHAHFNLMNARMVDGASPADIISTTSTANRAYKVTVFNCSTVSGGYLADKSWSKNDAGVTTVHCDTTPSSAYTPSNVTTDRSFNANATSTDELADVLGTLIADLQAKGLLG